MLTSFDFTAVIVYKILRENTLYDKIDFNKEELEQYFINVLNMAQEVGCDWDKITYDTILEIKSKLSKICNIQDDGIKIDSDQFKPKGKRKADMYIQGMDYALLWCCSKTFKQEILNKQNSKETICD